MFHFIFIATFWAIPICCFCNNVNGFCTNVNGSAHFPLSFAWFLLIDFLSASAIGLLILSFNHVLFSVVDALPWYVSIYLFVSFFPICVCILCTYTFKCLYKLLSVKVVLIQPLAVMMFWSINQFNFNVLFSVTYTNLSCSNYIDGSSLPRQTKGLWPSEDSTSQTATTKPDLGELFFKLGLGKYADVFQQQEVNKYSC